MTPTEFLDRKLLSGKPRKCWMCGCNLDRWTASVDHLQPASKGGKDRADNYRLACKPCNSGRGNAVISKALRLELQGRLTAKVRDFTALSIAIRRSSSGI